MSKRVQGYRSRLAAKLATSVVLTVIGLGGSPALAQTFSSGSTGADGAFAPTTNTTLALPSTGVFNFTTVNIPAGVTVTFTRNAANTPVTILASGNVILAGTINLNAGSGANALSGTNIVPSGGVGGPGGFDGGDGADGIASTTGGAGLGPGGGTGGPIGTGGGGGASFGTAGSSGGSGATPGPTYGSTGVVPLIGGSGGGGGGTPFGLSAAGGGGGAGAILIASSGAITFTGSITAIGGKGGNPVVTVSSQAGAGGGGSGGAVRLVASTITGNGGSISVAGGSGGSGSGLFGGAGGIGRIRVEAFTNTATISFVQAPSIDKPGVLALPGLPSLMITSVAGVAAPASPTGSFANPDITLPVGTANPMTISLAASNIPLGTTVTVTVKPLDGAASSATSTALAGSLAASTASASLAIATNQPSVISASATFTLVAGPGVAPLFAQGEQVEQARVAAVLGGPPGVTYITTSGREVAAATAEDLR